MKFNMLHQGSFNSSLSNGLWPFLWFLRYTQTVTQGIPRRSAWDSPVQRLAIMALLASIWSCCDWPCWWFSSSRRRYCLPMHLSSPLWGNIIWITPGLLSPQKSCSSRDFRNAIFSAFYNYHKKFFISSPGYFILFFQFMEYYLLCLKWSVINPKNSAEIYFILQSAAPDVLIISAAAAKVVDSSLKAVRS